MLRFKTCWVLLHLLTKNWVKSYPNVVSSLFAPVSCFCFLLAAPLFDESFPNMCVYSARDRTAETIPPVFVLGFFAISNFPLQ